TNGLIILDNSDWLPATSKYLRQAGLIEVDFSGPVHGNGYSQTTSFFFTRNFDFQPIGERQPLAPIGGRIDNWEAALEWSRVVKKRLSSCRHVPTYFSPL